MDIPQWINDLPPVAVALVSAAIAIISLLISGTSLFIHWRNYRRDSHDVDVELQWNAKIIHEHGMRSPVKQRFGHIIVTNKGRRPVHVTYVGLQLPGRRNSSANWLEKGVTLEEGDPSIIIEIPQDSVLEPFLGEWNKMYATVRTNTGRSYRSKLAFECPIIVPGFDWKSAGLLQDFTALKKFER